jgi:hypothetical protein
MQQNVSLTRENSIAPAPISPFSGPCLAFGTIWTDELGSHYHFSKMFQHYGVMAHFLKLVRQQHPGARLRFVPTCMN